MPVAAALPEGQVGPGGVVATTRVLVFTCSAEPGRGTSPTYLMHHGGRGADGGQVQREERECACVAEGGREGGPNAWHVTSQVEWW